MDLQGFIGIKESWEDGAPAVNGIGPDRQLTAGTPSSHFNTSILLSALIVNQRH
jgi:hypothetical protein